MASASSSGSGTSVVQDGLLLEISTHSSVEDSWFLPHAQVISLFESIGEHDAKHLRSQHQDLRRHWKSLLHITDDKIDISFIVNNLSRFCFCHVGELGRSAARELGERGCGVKTK
jgi:hypothetical protein